MSEASLPDSFISQPSQNGVSGPGGFGTCSGAMSCVRQPVPNENTDSLPLE